MLECDCGFLCCCCAWPARLEAPPPLLGGDCAGVEEAEGEARLRSGRVKADPSPPLMPVLPRLLRSAMP